MTRHRPGGVGLRRRPRPRARRAAGQPGHAGAAGEGLRGLDASASAGGFVQWLHAAARSEGTGRRRRRGRRRHLPQPKGLGGQSCTWPASSRARPHQPRQDPSRRPRSAASSRGPHPGRARRPAPVVGDRGGPSGARAPPDASRRPTSPEVRSVPRGHGRCPPRRRSRRGAPPAGRAGAGATASAGPRGEPAAGSLGASLRPTVFGALKAWRLERARWPGAGLRGLPHTTLEAVAAARRRTMPGPAGAANQPGENQPLRRDPPRRRRRPRRRPDGTAATAAPCAETASAANPRQTGGCASINPAHR